MTKTQSDPLERPARYLEGKSGMVPERCPYFPSFMEKLVVAIVTAHPRRPDENEDERHLRVREAVCALTGGTASPGAPPSYDLPETFNAFLTVDQKGVVANERNDLPRRLSTRLHDEVDIRDFAMDTPREDSLTRLAERAADKRRNPSVSAQTIRRRVAQTSYRNYLMDVLHRHVEEEEAEMKGDLDRVAEILARWNIRADVDPIALALASFWTEKEEDVPGENRPS